MDKSIILKIIEKEDIIRLMDSTDLIKIELTILLWEIRINSFIIVYWNYVIYFILLIQTFLSLYK